MAVLEHKCKEFIMRDILKANFSLCTAHDMHTLLIAAIIQSLEAIRHMTVGL